MAELTVETIESAEEILGVTYSASERALMLDNLEGQMLAAQACRALNIGNDVPMASRFDPRLPSFKMPSSKSSIKRSENTEAPLPENDEDIAYAPVTDLSRWIEGGKLSSRRLTEIYLARIDDMAGELECFVTVTRELALEQADAADLLIEKGKYLGPLHGIPYGLKDLFDTAGIRTSWGATPYKDRVPDKNARVVELLNAAGAVMLGKTTLGALAYGDVWFDGKTRNPWNLNEGSSGSSAGSASATAAGLCGFTIGTETLGSIASPSQRCGTTGLRPTFGRVSRVGGMALSWTMDKVGPICRTVEDCLLVLSAINGKDELDRSSINALLNFDASAGISDLRVGYIKSAFENDEVTEVEKEALAAVKRLGSEVVEVELPELPYDSLLNILFAESAAAFEELTLSDRDDELVWQSKAAWPNVFRKARFLSAVDHIQLERLRYQVMEAVNALFEEIDILVGPLSTGPMLVASNYTGHPCLHIRAGFLNVGTRPDGTIEVDPHDIPHENSDSPKFKVPQGISLWSGLFDEGRLCNFGMAFEAELDVAHVRPTFAR